MFSLLVCAFRISCDPEAPHADYMKYIDGLPMNPDPEAFGMHANANITSDQNDTYEMFDLLLSLQVWDPQCSSKPRADSCTH